MDESDHDYFTRRAEEEMRRARESLDPKVAAKHRQLATIYTSRALRAERKREL